MLHKLIMKKGLSLSGVQIRIMKFINDKGPSTLETIYISLGMNKKTACYHLKRLEYFGLLKTNTVSSDHRIKPRTLSRLGKEILKLVQNKKNDNMLNTERLKPNILAAIRGNLSPDLNEHDTSVDEKINKMGNDELFERFLAWRGIPFKEEIINTIENIYEVEIK